jgi:hypothetical protein
MADTFTFEEAAQPAAFTFEEANAGNPSPPAAKPNFYARIKSANIDRAEPEAIAIEPFGFMDASRYNVSPKQMQDAMDWIDAKMAASGAVELGQPFTAEEAQALEGKRSQAPGTPAQVAAGAQNVGVGLAQGISDARFLPLMGAGGPAGKAVALALGAKAASDLPEQGKQLGEALATGDPYDKTVAILNPAVGAMMIHGGAEAVREGVQALRQPKDSSQKVTLPVGEVSEFGGLETPAPAKETFSFEEAQSERPEAAPQRAADVSSAVRPSDETSEALSSTTLLQPKAFPVVEVPLKELALSKDVPNFKADADETTGVVAGQKLEGKYERLGTGAITVYERTDGSKEVISGRHRFDLAKRTGEETVPSQIVREADGFTPQMAMILDAEMNIRDGQGSVSDYANYFRNTELSPEQAAQRGLVARAKGKAGWTIGRNLSEDTFALYRAGKIEEGQAVAIGNAASGDAAMQRVGVKAALEKKSPQEISNFIQAVKLETRNLPPEQFDLFAADDSALKEAERLASVATRIQGEIAREIRATDAAAKNATTAKAKGLKFEKPPEEILADNTKAKAERDAWDNWALDPSKVQQVRDYAEMGRKQSQSPAKKPKGTKAKTETEAPPELESIKYEGGPADRTTGGAYPNVNEIYYGNKGEEVTYQRTDRKDADGRIIFKARSRRITTTPLERKQMAKMSGNQAADFVLAKADRIEKAQKASIEAKLDKLKIDTRGQLHAFGLLPEAWNTLIDLVKLGVKGGRKIAEAVDWAFAEFKKQNAGVNFDEAGAREHLLNLPSRQRVEKILASDVSPEVKAGVAPDLNYVPRSFEQVETEARSIIAQRGIEGAAALFKNPNTALPLDTRQALGAQLQDHFALQEKMARARGDQAQSDHFAGQQVELWKADAYGTELAQGLNARKIYDKMSPTGMLRQAKELFGEQSEKNWGELKPAADQVKDVLQKANAEAVEAVRHDPEVNRAAKAAVDAQIEQSPETHRAIVMELAEPFGQSPVILQHAREAVRAKVNELLNKAPRPPGMNLSQHYRALLNRMAQAAADIANSHYQGGEPGVPLKDKLMARLGIAEKQALQMARKLDAQFAKMVEKKKFQIKQRVAEQRARRELLMRPQDHVSQSRSVWSREKEQAAKSLVKALEPTAAPQKTALQEFAGRLTARLKEQLNAGKATPGKKLSDLEVIREAITNADKYQEVWDQALQDIQHRHGDAAVAGLDSVAQLFGHGQVDRVLRTQLKAMNIKLGEVLKKHKDVVATAGKNMAAEVVRASGLTGANAVKLEEVLHRRFEAIGTERKRAMLEALQKSPARVPRQVARPFDKLIRLSNLGAFEDAKFYDIIKKQLDLPAMTDELAREIARRANDLQKIPQGFMRDRAAGDLMNYVATQKGLRWVDYPMGIFYSNVLSGFTTPAKIVFENTNLLVGNTIASMLVRPKELFNPIKFLESLGKAELRGLGKGALQAESTLRTGVVTGVWSEARSGGVMELKPFGEKFDAFNFWKYFGRVIGTAHETTFKPAWEVKQTLIARDVARKEGLSGPALEQRVADLLANTDAAVTAARAQAHAELPEYFKPRGAKESVVQFTKRQLAEGADFRRRVGEIIEQQREVNMPGSGEVARDFALRTAYLNEPYGFLGLIAEGVRSTLERGRQKYPILGTAAKTQVPFTTVVANILNEKLNWTPVGAGRALASVKSGELYGRTIMAPNERAELIAKSILGTAVMATAATVFAKHIHGNGPGSSQHRKQLQATGWIPHSVEFNGKYYSYMNTPAALGLAIIGNYLDWHRYGKGDEADGVGRAAFTTKAVANAIVSQGMLDSMKRFFEALGSESTSEGADKLQKLVARTATAFVVPNLLQQLDRHWDPTIYDQTGTKALVLSQIPFVRRGNKPALNVLGETVQSAPFHYWASTQSKDPVWRVLIDKGAFVPEPNRNQIIGDKKRGPDHYRAMTSDEFYVFVAESGRAIRERLTRDLDRLADMEPEQAQKEVLRIAHQERAKVKRQFR